MHIETVLAAVEGRESAPPVVAAAAALAERFDARLFLLHAVSEAPERAGVSGEMSADFLGAGRPLDEEVSTQPMRDQAADEIRSRRRWLREIADNLKARGIDAEAMTLQGKAGPAIVAEAENVGAGLIVVGTRTSGYLREIFSGSVSKDVIRAAARPVLVVPLDAPGA